jgi:hypothetical protein
LAAASLPYGVADGDGDGEGLSSLFFLVVVDSFLVASVVVSFLVDDFLVVDVWVLAGDFSGAVVVVVDDSVLLVQALMRPAAKRTVME